jgi:hypothetical protein
MLRRERKSKEKSSMRFQQVNVLCDQVVRNLPNASSGLVLLVCWRHADEDGVFCLSVSRIAQSIGKSERQIKRTMIELQKVGAIKLIKPAIGTRAPTFVLTGNPRGDTHDTSQSAKPIGTG